MKHLVALLMISVSLYAEDVPEDQPMTLEAVHMDYKDKTIKLAGDVIVEHEFGRLCAQDVVIHSRPGAKRASLGTICLQDRVNIVLRDSGQLSCSSAMLDPEAMQGEFSGDVVYTETCRNRRQEGIPLIVRGSCMTLAVSQERANIASSGIGSVRRITASGDVRVNYNHDFIVHADKGVYEKSCASEEKNSGTVLLAMDAATGRCRVVNRNGDLITASRIEIDTLTRLLTFSDAKGFLSNSREEGQAGQPIEFSCRMLQWNGANDQITLREDVEIDQPGLGRMSTKEEVRILQQVRNNKKQLSLLETQGKTVIVFKEPNKPVEHTLTSYGKVVVDHVQLFTTMDSPFSGKKNVDEDTQVSFQDDQGQILADKALLYYSVEGGKVSLSKIRLEGHVSLKDKQASSGEVLHYVIADFVEYFPEAKEMTFTSKARRRVLFYDQINNVQVSAPALNIKRDEFSKKEFVKGIGDVRFSFIDQEYAQLRKRFKFESNEATQP